MNRINFQKKSEELKRMHMVNPLDIDRLETFIREADDYSLFRINPYYYASENSLEENQSLDLFLHFSKIGIFFMEWLLICPRCGGCS